MDLKRVDEPFKLVPAMLGESISVVSKWDIAAVENGRTNLAVQSFVQSLAKMSPTMCYARTQNYRYLPLSLVSGVLVTGFSSQFPGAEVSANYVIFNVGVGLIFISAYLTSPTATLARSCAYTDSSMLM